MAQEMKKTKLGYITLVQRSNLTRIEVGKRFVETKPYSLPSIGKKIKN